MPVLSAAEVYPTLRWRYNAFRRIIQSWCNERIRVNYGVRITSSRGVCEPCDLKTHMFGECKDRPTTEGLRCLIKADETPVTGGCESRRGISVVLSLLKIWTSLLDELVPFIPPIQDLFSALQYLRSLLHLFPVIPLFFLPRLTFLHLNKKLSEQRKWAAKKTPGSKTGSPRIWFEISRCHLETHVCWSHADLVKNTSGLDSLFISTRVTADGASKEKGLAVCSSYRAAVVTLEMSK